MRVIHLKIEHVVLAKFVCTIELHVIFVRAILAPLTHRNQDLFSQSIVDMLCTIILALMQIINHPAPFIMLAHITPLHKKFRGVNRLMAAVIFVEIVSIDFQSRRNHVEVTFHINPETVRQVPIDPLIRPLDHPIIILPLKQEICILVVIVLAPTFRIICRVSFTHAIVFQPLHTAIHLALPRSCAIRCVVCCSLCRSHGLIASQFRPRI